jgi:PAS domain-containing protein
VLAKLVFETLFEHMADAVYLLDPETSNIVWGNRSAWESLGLTPDEVLNHSVLSLQMDVTGMRPGMRLKSRSIPRYLSRRVSNIFSPWRAISRGAWPAKGN